MKTVLILIIFLCSFQIQAACKCNCDPTDNKMCASQNDMEHPCPSVCASAAPGMAPMFTACPVSKVTDPVTGVTRWVNMCN
ncbi:hypothetical protein [Legionella pneumophila]|uniref:Uncharacterized protein n=1 Tax=Legionella pneumophila subsp. pascullei TaxID=91890 RepID=A0AAX2J037_LEGPN|nr:hypothetical protein [Legionella pneumophila]AMP89395.1 hypothetical protein AXF35_06755 [Legionella pneumophila subsp. pascullei]AMP92939.1 hypothetical protein AXF36_10045 [Legionella pneumophila subsp. pascullei]AMP95905.1 hypothetical protein AXF37_09935 [Legionella pneumophila subsp. pascullei]SQG90828.1 Uncharacterised protein [Legionella pneumophila subsp. pascullei]VEH07373.1 Uncharacterised protein [Legionella pneumophila subsp. pascullei]